MKNCLLLIVLVSALASVDAVETNAVTTLPTVTVWEQRAHLPSADVQEHPWDKAPAALSARSSGGVGATTDLSINGSAFSEAGIVFNGAAIRNAHTEHFNSDLPAPADWFAPVNVLSGLDLFRLSSGHPAGSLVAHLDEPTTRGGKASLGVGLDGLVFGRVDDLETFSIGSAGRGWAGAFAEAAHADKTDGYDANPMDRGAAGGRLGFGAENWTFDSLLSWNGRDFGCTGAYGANEKYPAWENDQTGLLSADWKYDADDDQASEISFLWTRARDIYDLYRDNPDFYRNRHLTDAVTLHGTTRRHFNDWAFIDLRSDADAEIYSTTHHTNYTGNDPKTKDEDFRRFHGSLAAIPGVRYGNWEFAAGASAELYSDFDSFCAPAGGITYHIDETSKVSLSYREGGRMPSYTELTYDSPDSTGTRDLPLQRTRTLSLDATWERPAESNPEMSFRRARGGLFLTRSEDLVDWLKASRTASWKATSLEPVTSFGLSGDADFKVSDQFSLLPRGALVLKQTDSDYWASRYAMDFPIASAILEASYKITDEWRVSYGQGIEVWKSNPVRRGSSVRNVSRLETVFELPFCRDLSVTLGLRDLFDQAFEVYPGQKAPGFMGYLTVTYRW